MGQARRARHDRPVQRLPMPVLFARRADDATRCATRTARTRSASCGRTIRFRSTRTPSRPPRPPRVSTRSQASDAFWKFHDRRSRTSRRSTTTAMRSGRQEAGVKDFGRVQGGPRRPQMGRQGRQGSQRSGKSAGVQGTPAFFVNGVFINGAQPFDEFKKTIDQELQKAQAKIAAGTPKVARLRRDDQGEQEERLLRQPRRERRRRTTPPRCSRSRWDRARCSAARTPS